MRSALGVFAVLAFAGLAVLAPGAPATPRTLPLTVTITGSGVVTVGAVGRLACKTKCRKTFNVRTGSRLALIAKPASRWKMTGWTGSCATTRPTCALRVARAVRVVVTFVPPGSRANPIPLGTEASIEQGGGEGWHVKVVSVIPDGTGQVLAADPKNTVFAPDPGEQDFLVFVSATPRIGGDGLDLLPLIGHLLATVPGGDTVYRADVGCGTLPAPDLLEQGVLTFVGAVVKYLVQPNTTATGYVCFQIPTSAANHLMLFTEPPLVDPAAYSDPPPTPDADAVWFALR